MSGWRRGLGERVEGEGVGCGLQLAFCVLDMCLEEIKSRIPEVTHSRT